jgi:TRAP-type C4-dicarboxylate transport system permease large subunit
MCASTANQRTRNHASIVKTKSPSQGRCNEGLSHAHGWELRLSLLRTVLDSAMLAGMVLFILAAASGFSWALTVAYLPQRLVELLHSINDDTALFLIASIALLIVIGSVLEGLPALIILAPLLLPIAPGLGLSQLHYGIVLLIAMGVGAFLPPAGVGFYVACSIIGTDIETASRAMLPYLVVLILIVAFVPWFTVFLPGALNLGG